MFPTSENLNIAKTIDASIQNLINDIRIIKHSDLATDERRSAIHSKIEAICTRALQHNATRESKKIIKVFQQQSSSTRGLSYLNKHERFKLNGKLYTRDDMIKG